MPHTSQETTVDSFVVGRKVNLEVDVIARYLERLISGKTEQLDSPESRITMELLQKMALLKPKNKGI